MWGEFAPRVERALAAGNSGAVERLTAEVERQARQRAVVAARAMLNFQEGRGGPGLNRPFARGTPTLSGAENQPVGPPTGAMTAPGSGTPSALPSSDDLLQRFVPAPVGAPTTGSAMEPSAPMAPTPMTPPPSYTYSPEARPISVPYHGTVGQSASTAYHPIADALASWGVGQMEFWAHLAQRAAPGVNWAERAARGFLGAAGEATGLPSAARAGEAAAAGDYPRAIGQGLMALPSRLASIPGMFMSGAEAQAPDPRLKRIQELNAEISQREKRLQGYGNRQFPSAKARADAVGVENAGITAARDEAKAIRDAMAGETAQAAAAERARLASAQWAETPTARAYPGSPAAMAGVGMLASLAIPYARARGAVGGYDTQVAELLTGWRAAIDRAKNTQLAPRTRTAAAAEARQFQTQFEAIAAAGPRTGGHGRAFLEGVAPTELALAAPRP